MLSWVPQFRPRRICSSTRADSRGRHRLRRLVFRASQACLEFSAREGRRLRHARVTCPLWLAREGLRERSPSRWSRRPWDLALEEVLAWLWRKRELLTGQPRPDSARITDANRAALQSPLAQMRGILPA